jgi:hypothetical protein
MTGQSSAVEIPQIQRTEDTDQAITLVIDLVRLQICRLIFQLCQIINPTQSRDHGDLESNVAMDIAKDLVGDLRLAVSHRGGMTSMSDGKERKILNNHNNQTHTNNKLSPDIPHN